MLDSKSLGTRKNQAHGAGLMQLILNICVLENQATEKPEQLN
jgi:hypothetical protein